MTIVSKTEVDYVDNFVRLFNYQFESKSNSIQQHVHWFGYEKYLTILTQFFKEKEHEILKQAREEYPVLRKWFVVETTISLEGIKKIVSLDKRLKDRCTVCTINGLQEKLRHELSNPHTFVVETKTLDHVVPLIVFKRDQVTYFIALDSINKFENYDQIQSIIPKDGVFISLNPFLNGLGCRQKDSISCWAFALEDCKRVLKNPSLIDQVINSSKSLPRVDFIRRIDAEALPWQFYCITQSVNKIDDFKVNLGEETRKKFEEKVSKYIDVSDSEKVNRRIDHLRRKWELRLLSEAISSKQVISKL